MKRDHIFSIVLAAIAIALLYLLNKKGLLHESVTAKIITPQNTVTSDPTTGYPQYDTSISSTVPEQEAFAVAPIDSNGNITQFPKDTLNCTCPVGYEKWRNAHDGSIWCLPTTSAAPPLGTQLV